MKLVTLMISPTRLDALKRALWAQGFKGLSVSQAEGFAFQRGVQEAEGDLVATPSQRLRVDVAVKDAEVESLVEAAVEALRTGRVGDGKIFVTALDEVVRVRTGERGDTAL